jgi:hypothetical protein
LTNNPFLRKRGRERGNDGRGGICVYVGESETGDGRGRRDKRQIAGKNPERTRQTQTRDKDREKKTFERIGRYH